jgi:hypothetical protein
MHLIPVRAQTVRRERTWAYVWAYFLDTSRVDEEGRHPFLHGMPIPHIGVN